ncbi:MAG: signal peptidase I, partial [Chloroflexi bacterium]|nr:signal peptidase I [Chloroflexota bacterium]
MQESEAGTTQEIKAADRGSAKRAIRELLETVVLAVLIFFLVRTLVQNFKVEGSSMEPGLSSGQYLIVNKILYIRFNTAKLSRFVPFIGGKGQAYFYPFHPPRKGDVIVFRFPQNQSRDFIKRVIATPGDTVEIRHGQVLVNGYPLEEPYVTSKGDATRPPEVIPPDNYFVLGDNRNNSSDSRMWGLVPRSYIVGKAWLRYWPFRDWGFIKDYPLSSGLGTE